MPEAIRKKSCELLIIKEMGLLTLICCPILYLLLEKVIKVCFLIFYMEENYKAKEARSLFVIHIMGFFGCLIFIGAIYFFLDFGSIGPILMGFFGLGGLIALISLIYYKIKLKKFKN